MSTRGNVTLPCVAHTRGLRLTGSSRRDGSRHVAPVRRQRGRAAQEDAPLRNRRTTTVEEPGCPASAQEGSANSSGHVTRRAAFISDGALLFTAAHSTAAKLHHYHQRKTPMRSSVAVLISSLAVGLMFSTLSARAAITHTTSNLNLRAGPGTHHRVKAIIPAGARIDIESCGHAWCYMAWAGHVGYVKHQYLMHHVTAEVPPLVHVTHVHKHGLINF